MLPSKGNEFFYDTSSGRIELQQDYGYCPECPVKSSGLLVPPGNPRIAIFRCVYIGTQTEYMNVRATCEDMFPDPRNPHPFTRKKAAP
jgi:hypothetical protein